MYILAAGENEEKFENRADAITAAKAASAEVRYKVVLMDEAGLEQFIYRGGELEQYEYETRPRRR